MTSFLWVITEKRKELLDALINIPEYGKKSKSELMELALEEFIKKHGESNNPQSKITGFNADGILAIPNLYEACDNPTMWEKFYANIKNKKEYQEIDNALNHVMNLHNKKLREL